MNHRNASGQRGLRPLLYTTSVAALAAALMAALPQNANAHRDRPPAVPSDIVAPEGHELFLEGHAVGTQNYVCAPSGTGVAWALFTPQATLFKDNGKQLTTHFFSPNPDEKGTVRATWQHSRDTSSVWGFIFKQSDDANFVAPGAIPWLLVQKSGDQEGPSGGDTLTETTYIQRINTLGGSAPATGCAAAADLGKKVFVPYTADYLFYTNHHRDHDR